ncbi:Gfo/Idh/MocA family protein [Planctomycetota bacterium]
MALCDVNELSDYTDFYYGDKKGGLKPALKIVENHYGEQKKTGAYKGCAEYIDFYRMLEEEKDIDAVLIATPDHIHAVACMAAIKKKKHIYCEKPLTRTIYESRVITEAARQAGVATQMGNHGHSGEGIRLTVEWIQAGAIGPVREVHAWTEAGGEWTDMSSRPEQTPPVPSTLDWDKWLGPAPYRPYHPAYVPYRWRGWWDFGTGAIGDMACHNVDPAFWAMKLICATSFTVEASSTDLNEETIPKAGIYRYKFPARGQMPPVTFTWYNGGLMPPRPEELEEGREMESNGVYFVGDKGVIKCPGWGGAPRIIPETKMQAYKRPPKSLPRAKEHHQDWLQACKTGNPACSNFDYAGPLTEMVLLGNVALRTGKKLQWDCPKMKAVNAPEADKYIRPTYRQGWSL